jgi:hypothetical protein
VSKRDALEERPDERAREPVEHIEMTTEFLERRPETMLARPVRLKYAIQCRLIPGLVPRSRAQRFISHRQPVGPEGLHDRAALSLAPKTLLEEFLEARRLEVCRARSSTTPTSSTIGASLR